ncbi:hypothetical protein CNMCM5793_006408 [Aspergillus hiratsukae]|uniref:Uncharacterized protein n=1 Tax=Aspergillus hiratsukae TaxID=1194566 RepID=A0A8H6PH85_9EURO|nr:hypothetical protein CNMCM5793_006408 [Aspergillus hiratsukae]KAF7173113.1 hypothetical protein CNMCM6106_007256 [Aspergillus hiratsukae]
MASKPTPRNSDFGVGILSALPLEAHADRGIFDEIYYDGTEEADAGTNGRAYKDTNSYTKGRIGPHEVVLAHIPGMGKANASNAASNLRLSFTGLQLVLLVGICGGVPHGPDGTDIMLGDVIIGKNVIQYDFERQFPDGSERKKSTDGNLATQGRPSIRSFITKLESCKISKTLEEMTATELQSLLRKPGFEQSKYPGSSEDRLFLPDYVHKHRNSPTCECSVDGKICALAKQSSCEELRCNLSCLEPRKTCQEQPSIYFGSIASGDKVIKSGQHRDQIAKREGVIAFEMEAAGVWEYLPCLVVKGVCDYADSHKNKKWQPYAAAAASACARSVLQHWDVTNTPRESQMVFSTSDHSKPHLELPRALEALFNRHNETETPVCHENTRTAVLEQIYDWFENNDDRPVFWLTGWAGTGKSTIARTVARQYEKKALGASFFFSRDKEDCGSAAKFVTTIAYQLAIRSPSLEKSICDTLRQNDDVLGESLFDQWRRLVLEPVSSLDVEDTRDAQKYLLVIDALDECKDDCDTLVKLLFGTTSARIRLFVTSRPDWRISPEKWKSQYRSIVLHHVDSDSVKEDISRFLHDSLAGDQDWPGPALLERLVERAGGLFLWAASASRFLTDSPEVADSRLCELLGDEGWEGESERRSCESSNSRAEKLKPDKILDLIYLAVLTAAISPTRSPEGGLRQKEENICLELMRRYLGSIVVLFAQLSPHALYTLVEIDTEEYGGIHAHSLLQKLQAILDIPINKDENRAVIRLHHPSLCDFVLNDSRCNDSRFYVCRKQAHRIVLKGCLRLLSRSLRQDICGIGAPDASVKDVSEPGIDQVLPPAVQYACLYWVKHLQASELVHDDYDIVYVLLHKHVLHWLEALSWMGRYHDGIEALAALDTLLLHKDEHPQLSTLVKDALRFARCHGPIVKQAPLQIYIGALVFSPQGSLIRQRHADIAKQYVEYLPRTKDTWGRHLHSLDYHHKPVTRLAFSDERQILASASTDGIMRLWDVTTGRCLHVIEGFNHEITIMRFSPHGKRLASLSSGIIQVWDVATGRCLQTIDGSHGFKAIAFPEEENLIAVSGTHQVQYWDIASKVYARCIHSLASCPASIAFSDDAKTLATWSSDDLIRVWNISADGCSMKWIPDSIASPYAVALSPDGKIIAAAASTAIQALDTETGECLLNIKGRCLPVQALAVSSRKRLLASEWDRKTIKLWSFITRQCLYTVEGHSQQILAVILSEKSSMLASGSMDGIAKLWDLSSIDELHINDINDENNNRKTVTALALEDRAMLAAVGYGDASIQLYHPCQGQHFIALSGHGGRVNDLAFLPDGVTLASASLDRTLRLWNTEWQNCSHVLKGHTSSVTRIVTAHAIMAIASLSIDRTVRVWDAQSGRCLHTLTGHTSSVEGAAFSKDDTMLATSSSDHTIRLWYVEGGVCVRVLKGHVGWVMGLDFAEDQKMLVSAAIDRTVRLWDVQSGSCLQEYSHAHQLRNVAMSGDNCIVASIGLAKVSVWDIRSGKCIQVLDCRESRDVRLSSHGRYLETDYGSLMLGKDTIDAHTALEQPASAIYVARSWVIVRGKKILYLPSEYRNPTYVAVRGNTAILAYRPNQVFILRFR